MNEEMQQNNQTQQSQRYISSLNPPSNSVAKPTYKISNYITLIYVVLLVVTVFNSDVFLSQVLFFTVLVMGIIAGLSFVNRVAIENKDVENRLVFAFRVFVSLGGAFAIFFISLIAGFMGILHASPPQGD